MKSIKTPLQNENVTPPAEIVFEQPIETPLSGENDPEIHKLGVKTVEF